MSEAESIKGENQKLVQKILFLENQNASLKMELKKKDDLSEMYDNIINCLNVEKMSLAGTENNEVDVKKLKSFQKKKIQTKKGRT